MAGLCLTGGAATAADVINTYNFSGTLTNSINSESSVTGSFTLDQTTGALNSSSFDTPFGALDGGGVATYTPAVDPAADFTEIYISSGPFENLDLFFQTDVSTFSGSSFYTGLVSVQGGAGQSALSCMDPGACSVTASSSFSSGAATIAVPEPETWMLMMAGIFGLGSLIRNRRGSQPEQAI